MGEANFKNVVRKVEEKKCILVKSCSFLVPNSTETSKTMRTENKDLARKTLLMTIISANAGCISQFPGIKKERLLKDKYRGLRTFI